MQTSHNPTIKSLVNICNTLDCEGFMKGEYDIPLSKVFELDLLRYIMFLSASDGKVVAEEKDYMNSLFDQNFTVNDYAKLIEDTKSYGRNFCDELPLSVEILAAAEAHKYYLKARTGMVLNDLSSRILQLYKTIGEEIISCDNIVTALEESDLKEFISKKKAMLQVLTINNVRNINGNSTVIIPNIGKDDNDSIVLRWKNIFGVSKYVVYVYHHKKITSYTVRATSYHLSWTFKNYYPKSEYGFMIAPLGAVKNINDLSRKDFEIIVSPKEKPISENNLSPIDVIVLSTMRRCTNSNHHVSDVMAVLPVYKDGAPEIQKINVGYCEECNKYIMLSSDYTKINGKPICWVKDIHSEKVYNKPYHYEEMTTMNTESILHKHGYNVRADNGLYAQNRQNILRTIVIQDILSKNEIISHLEGLINLNGQKANMTAAVHKWQADIEYLRKLNTSRDKGLIVSITRK